MTAGEVITRFVADITGFSSGISRMVSQASSFESTIAGHVSRVGSGFLNMGKSIVGGIEGMGRFIFFGKQLVSTGASLVQGFLAQNASMEQTRIAFVGLLGSGQAADTMLRNLQTFAASTPFEFPELAKDTQMLVGMGFAAKDVIPIMTAVGDAAAGVGGGAEGVESITRALGQMQAKGKITGEEMMQMTEAGIPAWKILADSMGLSVAQVQELSQKGQLGGDAITKLWQGMEKMYGGQMAGQAQTFNGLLSTLHDNAIQALMAFAGPIFDMAKGGLQQLTALAGSPAFQNFAKTAGEMVGGALERIAAVIGPVVSWVGQLIGAFTQGDQALRAFSPEVALIRDIFSQLGQIISAVLGPSLALLAPIFNNMGASIAGVVPQGQGLATVLQNISNFLASLNVGPFSQFLALLTNTAIQVFTNYLANLKANFDAVWTIITTSVIPAFQQLWPSVQSLFTALAPLGPVLLSLGQTAMQLAGVIRGAVVTAFEVFLPIITRIAEFLIANLIPVINMMMPAFQWAAAAVKQFADDLSVRLEPAIRGLGVIITTVLDVVITIWNAVWPSLLPILQGVWDGIFGIIKIAWSLISGFINIALDLLAGNWGQAWKDMQTMFAGVWDGIVTLLRGVWEIISGIFQAMLNFLAGLWNTIWNAVVAVWNNILDSIKSAVTNIYNSIVSQFTTARDWLASTWNTISSTASSVWNTIWTSITNFVTNIYNSIVSQFTNARDWLASTWNTISSTASSTWNTIWTNITTFVGNIYTAITSKIADVQSFLSGAWNAIQTGVTNAWNGIVNAIRGAINSMIDVLNGGINGINNFVNGIADGINSVAKTLGLGTLVSHISIGLVPHLASGTDYWQGGVAMVGEEGPELAYLPRGSQVLNARDTNRVVQNGVTTHIPGLAEGTGDMLSTLFNWLVSGVSSIASNFMKQFNIGSFTLPGVFGDIASSLVGKITGGLGDYINSLFGKSTTLMGQVPFTGSLPMAQRGQFFLPAGGGFHEMYWYGVHQGMDMQYPQGSVLREIIGGMVLPSTGWKPWGGEVDVRIPNGLWERYEHMSQIAVRAGQILKRGDYLGLSGGGTVASGLGYWSNGAHLHIQYDTGSYGTGINPLNVWAAYGLFAPFSFARGGVINEPIVGMGLNSGRGYTFGENGPETIIPGRGSTARGTVINLVIDGRTLADALGDYLGNQARIEIGGVA